MNKRTYTFLGIAIISFAVVLVSAFALLFFADEPEFTSEDTPLGSEYIADESNDLATNIVEKTEIPSGEEIKPEKQGEIVLNENRKVVTFQKDLSEEEKEEIEKEYEVEFTEEQGQNGVYTIITTEESNIEELSEEGGAGSVETDVPVKIAADTVDWGVARIGADKIWEKSTGSSVVVAIVDTGIQLDHPDLQGNITEGYDFVNDKSTASDDHGHGTHVAGIVASIQNQSGTIGASHTARLMPIKALNSTGSGYISDVAKGIYWATDNGAQVINMSIGTDVDTSVLKEAIRYASRKGVLMTAAAGNESGSPCSYPAAYGEVICVVATDSSNRLASFSNIGGELAAPGVSNYSTFLGSTYRYLSGTSMASPHVAGSLALVREACQTCTGTELRDILRETAIDLGEEGYDIIFGYGLVDLVAAIDKLMPEEDEVIEDPVEEPADEPSEEPTEESPGEEEETPEPSSRAKAPEKKSPVEQKPVITKPERDNNGRFSMTEIEDIEVEFKLEPTVSDSNFEKSVLYLNNEPVYTTTKVNDTYSLSYDDFEGVQQLVKVTSFFSDGVRTRDQLIVDRSELTKLRPSNSIIQRGRRVLGISSSFSLMDLFKF